jgi:hypothetical protein
VCCEYPNRTPRTSAVVLQCSHIPVALSPCYKFCFSALHTSQTPASVSLAQSASTGFSPFFLNYGRMPRSFIWNSALTTEFAGVRNFLLQKKLALISAHDSIIAARMKQTRDSNRKRQPTPFQQGDLVYLSTQNITFQKGLARKLIPK